jgi:hypothetical protein
LDTPTTIQPPQAFCNSPIQSNSSNIPHQYHQQQQHLSSSPPPTQIPPNGITLDPSTLQQGYANVKMMANGTIDKSHMESDMSKYNGNVGNGVVNNNNNSNNNNNHNSNGMVMGKDKNSNQPFSIQSLQGYSENFKENHSEISC